MQAFSLLHPHGQADRGRPLDRQSARAASAAAAAIAASLAITAWIAGWRGGDLSAQLFRVNLFRRYGLTLWNPQWYGGHFTLSYSVLYPPVAAVVGMTLSTILSASAAAWSFARLSLGWFGSSARTGIVLFAVGTGSQIAIGQLPFLMGEALALAALLAASRRRWIVSGALALGASLTSPLAGAFLVLVIVAWAVSSHRPCLRPLIGICVITALPVAITSIAFPGTGVFPYPSRDAALELLMIAVLTAAVPRRHRALRIGGLLYMGAMIASYVIASPMGGNVSRLAESVALPLVACVLWPTRRMLLAVVMVPMVLWQWVPAWPAMTTQPDEASTYAAYYAPLVTFLSAEPNVPSRVEVVPTKAHFEVSYVAPAVSLARGWERQVDTADNAVFYDAGALTAASYRAWLVDSGAQYVALPDAPLDFAATAEGALVRDGVPGLTPVWQSEHWTVFAVDGATGIVDGPASLDAINGDVVSVHVDAAGTVRLKMRYNNHWSIEPQPTCVGRDPSGWLTFAAPQPGLYELRVGLTPVAQQPCVAGS